MDEAGFLRAICEDPYNDVPRLVYADWLEEQGQVERAEFIRVQELANNRAAIAEEKKHAGIWHIGEITHLNQLRRRERELFESVRGGFRWPAFLELPDASVTPFCLYRRGFVSEVRCSAADWGGGECQRCRGSGEEAISREPSSTAMRDCLRCSGTGRIAGHGPAIVAACPVTRVRFTDREPYRTSGINSEWRGWYNWSLRSSHDRSEIPDEWLKALKGEIARDAIQSGGRGMVFASEQAAWDALSLVAINDARKQSGLPELSVDGSTVCQ